MNKKSLKELKKLIEDDIKYQDEFINLSKDNNNYQVKEMRIKAENRKESMEVVLNYINNGSKVLFNKVMIDL